MDFPSILVVITSLYALSFTVVFLAGTVPAKWQTWTTVHIGAWLIPALFLAVAIMIAYPALMVLLLIVAATTKRF